MRPIARKRARLWLVWNWPTIYHVPIRGAKCHQSPPVDGPRTSGFENGNCDGDSNGDDCDSCDEIDNFTGGTPAIESARATPNSSSQLPVSRP